jgi:hypothetical protein
MNITIASSKSDLFGDFLLDGDSLGDYLEVVFLGHVTQEYCGQNPAGVNVYTYSFSMVLKHSLIHDDAHVEVVFQTTSHNVAQHLFRHLRIGRLQRMHTEVQHYRKFTWCWPSVDAFSMPCPGQKPSKRG